MAPQDPNEPNGESPDSGETLDQDGLGALLSGGSLDEPEEKREDSQDPDLLKQADVDEHAVSSGGVDVPFSTEKWQGPRVPVQKEAIRDPALLEGLMGPGYEPPADDAPLSQVQLDALLARQAERSDEAGTLHFEGESPSVEREPITDPALLEKLLGEDREGATPPDESDTESGAAEAQEKELLLDQSALDALLAEQPEQPEQGLGLHFEGTAPPIAREPISDPDLLDALLGEEGDTAAPAEGELLSQEQLQEMLSEQDKNPPRQGRLMFEGTAPPIERDAITDPELLGALLGDDSDTGKDGEETAEDEALDQAALDALMAEGIAEEKPAMAADEETLDQAALDALMAEGIAQEKPAAASEDEALDSAALDALIAEGVPEEISSEEPEEDEPLDPAALDALLASGDLGEQKGDVSGVADAGGTAAALDEPLDAQDMEDSLAPASDVGVEDNAPVDQSDIDALLAVAAEEEGGDEELLSPDASAEAFNDSEDEVGSENVAAAAATESDSGDMLSQDLLDQLLTDAKEAEGTGEAEGGVVSGGAEAADEDFGSRDALSVLESEAVPGRIAISLPRWRIIESVGELVREDPVRAISSLAAGLLFTAATFGLLFTHQLKKVVDITHLTSSGIGDLDRAMLYAQDLIDKDKFDEAQILLHEVIARVPADADPLVRKRRIDARFLEMKAKFLGLPTKMSMEEGDLFHEELDRLLNTARHHERAPEAHTWNAKIYEAQDNVLAALETYQNILEEYPEPRNRDEVLYNLGRLELSVDLAVRAGHRFQTLLSDHPGSAYAASAKLLMGDAYAKAGATDSARQVYIQAIEDSPHSTRAAEASTRLGEMAYDRGNYERAIRYLEERLESATTVDGNDQVQLLLARAYRGQGRLGDARRSLQELRLFFPESGLTPETLIELSQVLNELGEIDEAVKIAGDAVQRYPADMAVLRYAGLLFNEAGDAGDARRALGAVFSAGDGEPAFLLAAGKVLQDAGALSEAREAYERLIEAFPAAGEALDGSIEMARVLFDQDEVGEALEQIEDLARTTQLPQRRLPILAAMGELYGKLGMRTAVADVYREVQDLSSEPEMLARAAIALLGAELTGEGLQLAAKVDLSHVSDEIAYRLLIKQGKTLLQADPREALSKMEKAYEQYPLERTAEGDLAFLDAALATGREGKARVIVADVQARVLRREEAVEPSRLERAAIKWGDFLYRNKAYRTAADAYEMALGDLLTTEAAGGNGPLPDLTTEQSWALYQRANSMFGLADFEGSIRLFERVSKGNSDWSREAAAKAAAARLEQRLRGLPVTSASGGV